MVEKGVTTRGFRRCVVALALIPITVRSFTSSIGPNHPPGIRRRSVGTASSIYPSSIISATDHRLHVPLQSQACLKTQFFTFTRTTGAYSIPLASATTADQDGQQQEQQQQQYAYLDAVHEGMAEAGFQDTWAASVTLLSERLHMEPKQAEACLAEAWNWKRWATITSTMARKYIKTIEPDVEALTEALEWWLESGPLASLVQEDQGGDSNHGTTLSFLRNAMMEYPEAYLHVPQKRYKQAMSSAPKQYRDPEDFKALVGERPAAMQLTYNCADDGCISECGTCWVTFGNSYY